MKGSIKHLAIIMDGNRRWAASRGLPAKEGHRAGVETLAEIVRTCAKLNIPYLTVYALSSENLVQRDKKEIIGLFSLIKEGLLTRVPELQKEGVKIEFLGDLTVLPAALKKAINQAYDKLARNSRIQLNIALNYGGRAEIVSATKELIKKKVRPEEVDEENFSHYLFTQGLPDPDLVIRTGGQQRISNFLLWQTAYSEWFFAETLWPDFDETQLNKALADFAARKRNFGR